MAKLDNQDSISQDVGSQLRNSTPTPHGTPPSPHVEEDIFTFESTRETPCEKTTSGRTSGDSARYMSSLSPSSSTEGTSIYSQEQKQTNRRQHHAQPVSSQLRSPTISRNHEPDGRSDRAYSPNLPTHRLNNTENHRDFAVVTQLPDTFLNDAASFRR